MNDFGDLNKIIKFAKHEGVSVKISYWEASDEMSIEVISAAKNECFEKKRAINVDHFIACWREHVNLSLIDGL